MSFNPMAQFTVIKLLPLYLPYGIDASFSNSSIYMVLCVAILALLAIITLRYKKTAQTNPLAIPSRMQIFLESIYGMVEKMLHDTAGKKAARFMPLIFTVFMFILLSDLLGMIPGSFAVTSHIAVTFFMAGTLFIIMTAIGMYRHGLHFFSLFLPKGTPVFLMPLMFVIELCVYLARPVSLSLRLAANVMAGHIVLKVIASLIVISGAVGVLPFLLLVILTAFEFFISILQAYIFTMLLCVYLNDAINLH